ncbi:hypothetical protein HUK80_15735 [Flavobacterium sp. MAH-1]|uniref:Uncharacterized protein n=1 Tax=Flavobacterium agri TaxID=2743471 RepID=A0A7Y8Y724_9FLAO|nr:hypothetical protein [Flavobacterium agri]NUY82356.1 hypothetical protein [Flavobacterium agri]NYA72380.1 hypothetical protein [Flavobacterium agri]
METEDLRYEEHEDFNIDFDDTQNAITILGSSFRPSEVLFYLQRETYRIALTDFRNQQIETLKETIYYEYPLPIAFYFHQSENAYDYNNHRLQLLRSTWEAIIFTLYAVVVGEARSKAFPLRNIAQVNALGNPDLSFNDYFSDRLAQKLLIVERILTYNQTNNCGLLCANVVTIPTIQKIRSLNQERNEFMHIAAISEEQAATSYGALFPEVLDVLKDLRELEFVDIMRFIQVTDAVTNLRCEIFNGHGLARNIKNITLSSAQLGLLGDQLNAQNILIKYQGELFSITPFLHFRPEANGNVTNLCYFKRKATNARYEYEIVSRSESVEFDRQVFQDRTNELRALIV